MKVAKGSYDDAKEARISKEKERDDWRMLWKCQNILKMVGAAHGIGSMEDKRTLEAERKKTSVK